MTVSIPDFKLKLELLENLDSDFVERLGREYNGSKKPSSPRYMVGYWKVNNKIKLNSVKQLCSAINDWLSAKYPGLNYPLSEKDLIKTSFKEFCDRLYSGAESTASISTSQELIYNMSDEELTRYAAIYAGYYDCRMYWIDPSGKSSVYRFAIRIGAQKIDGQDVKVDVENSINWHARNIKCYMSTLHQWQQWKKATGDDYQKVYEDYPWWNGEMEKIQGYGPLLWFKFWDFTADEQRYCVISASDRHRRDLMLKVGLDGLLLAQPGVINAPPACTRVYIQYYKNILKKKEIVDFLDKINYLGMDRKNTDDCQKKIQNVVSKHYNILEPYNDPAFHYDRDKI